MFMGSCPLMVLWFLIKLVAVFRPSLHDGFRFRQCISIFVVDDFGLRRPLSIDFFNHFANFLFIHCLKENLLNVWCLLVIVGVCSSWLVCARHGWYVLVMVGMCSLWLVCARYGWYVQPSPWLRRLYRTAQQAGCLQEQLSSTL